MFQSDSNIFVRIIQQQLYYWKWSAEVIKSFKMSTIWPWHLNYTDWALHTSYIIWPGNSENITCIKRRFLWYHLCKVKQYERHIYWCQTETTNPFTSLNITQQAYASYFTQASLFSSSLGKVIWKMGDATYTILSPSMDSLFEFLFMLFFIAKPSEWIKFFRRWNPHVGKWGCYISYFFRVNHCSIHMAELKLTMKLKNLCLSYYQ